MTADAETTPVVPTAHDLSGSFRLIDLEGSQVRGLFVAMVTIFADVYVTPYAASLRDQEVWSTPFRSTDFTVRVSFKDEVELHNHTSDVDKAATIREFTEHITTAALVIAAKVREVTGKTLAPAVNHA